MSSVKSTGWESISPFPVGEQSTNLVQINDTEFICGSFAVDNDIQQLLKFNIFTNKWTEWLTLPEELSFNSNAICFDRHTKMLYIAESYPTVDLNHTTDTSDKDWIHGMIVINIETKEYKHIEVSQEEGNVQRILSLPNGGIHFIRAEGGKHSSLGLNEQKTSEVLCSDGEVIGYKSITWNDSIYSSKDKEIFTFGGVGEHQGYLKSLDTIFTYNIEKAEHKLLDLKLPKEMCLFGCVITNDEKYVIIFGGLYILTLNTFKMENLQKIYIFDMNEMTVRESSIQCPDASTYNAIVMTNHVQELIVLGYIRKCWSLTEFDGFTPLSADIMNLIYRWYVEEMVYLLDRKSDKMLWKISIADILST